MFRPNKITGIVLLTTLLLNTSIGFAQKKKKEAAAGAPVLWQDPTDITSRDLYLGAGGDEMKPDLTKVTFIEEKTGGYSKKYEVRDGTGKKWVVKLGKE